MLPPLRRLRMPAAACALLSAVVVTPASASDTCIVQRSADGHVALRASPSAQGALVARARAGDGVAIQKSDSGDQIARGNWLRVLHFAGRVAPPTTDPAYKKGRDGWMHRRYVNDCG